MRWSLPITTDIASTFRNWRSEIVSAKLLSEDDFSFTDYEPTITMASGTVSDSDVRRAKWVKKTGNICLISIHAAWTASGATASLTITMPFAARSVGDSQGVALLVYDNGAWRSGSGIISMDSRDLVLTRYDAANFTAGTVGVMGNFWFEID